jgi:hypothetical protein
VDLLTQGPAYSDWWAFRNAGTCRQTALSASADFTANAGTCVDYWVGGASGGLTNFESGFSGTANRARVKALYAVPPSAAGPLDPGNEYYALKFNISNAKTVGTGSCTGCTDKVCLVLNSIRITQAVGLGNFDIVPAEPHRDVAERSRRHVHPGSRAQPHLGLGEVSVPLVCRNTCFEDRGACTAGAPCFFPSRAAHGCKADRHLLSARTASRPVRGWRCRAAADVE